MVVRSQASQEIDDQGQLYAICREIQALIHPALREHESIVKLQAIVWENRFGAGYESGMPMWPTLVLEYCETTLADHQTNNPPIDATVKSIIGSKIGSGLNRKRFTQDWGWRSVGAKARLLWLFGDNREW